MNASPRLLVTSALASACLGLCGLVQAQSQPTYGTSSETSSGMSSTMSQDAATTTDTASTPLAYDPPAAGYGNNSSYSWLPYTTRGYVGLNVGQAKYDDNGCVAGLECDTKSNRGFKVYTGGMFNEHVGLEIAYLNTGSVDRSGGDVKAHGLNISLKLEAPLGDKFAVFAKGGATYGWTETDGTVGENGDESGAGGAYGVGVRFNFTPNWAAVLEYESHKFRFADDRKDDVEFTTLGVQYRF